MRIEEEKNVSLDNIYRSIEKEKCILVPGPDLVFDFQKSLMYELNRHLVDEKIDCKFDETDELFASNIGFDPDFFTGVSSFFDSLKWNELHEKIAEIPFTIIISLSPDLLIKQAFDDKNFDYTFDYYDKTQNPKQNPDPTKQKPLLYNFIGSYYNLNSLVFCFKDVFSYLTSILGDFRLNEYFRYNLHSASSILFLGFKFDKWYFKLFLEMLNLGDKASKHSSLKEIEWLAGESEKQNLLIDFCKNEFKIKFLPQGGNEIIDLLHQKFTKNDGLRKPGKPVPALQDQGSVITVYGNNNKIFQDITDSKIES